MRFETTILRPVEANGIGLHSGLEASVRILPAAASSGIVFVRSDLESFEIPAQWKHVARVSYATSLMRKGVLLSTTEHLLSALYGMGIDNARVEIDNLEVPIFDGSALPFATLLRQAGVQSLRRRRRYLKIVRSLEVREGQKLVAVWPSDEFRITCRTDYNHPLAGAQKIEMEVSSSYSSEIAPARTFGFEDELDRMRDMGLIRGASLDNAVCFTSDGAQRPASGSGARSVRGPPQAAAGRPGARPLGNDPGCHGARSGGARRAALPLAAGLPGGVRGQDQALAGGRSRRRAACRARGTTTVRMDPTKLAAKS